MGEVSAFLGEALVARGERETVIRLLEDRYDAADRNAIRAFEDDSGRVTDLDYWDAGQGSRPEPPARSRGRPKLGVTSREITLLPRQWEWLGRQPAGASATIRRLVEEARKAAPAPAAGRDAVYRFMTDMCGDWPGYEEALRALYRGDEAGFASLITNWPADIRAYIERLKGCGA
jgi:hypothetical protein